MANRFASEPTKIASRIGVLLINLGSPAEATPRAVRRYLQQFLSDQRVIELPKWLWQPLLRWIILPFRSRKSAQLYHHIWLPEGSPLLHYTQKITEKLTAQFRFYQDAPVIRFAMSYGNPNVFDVIQEMKGEGVDRLLVIPLFPQYAASASGAALDKVWHTLLQQRHIMSIRTINSYHNDSGYIYAIANKIRQSWATKGRGDKLLFSFHGIPQAHADLGDPYPLECLESVRLIAQELNLSSNEYQISFQSQFGKSQWLQPSTQELIQKLPQQGIKNLDIVCPVFVTECLETLEEIATTAAKDFIQAGGERYQYIPCLNDDDLWIAAFKSLIEKNITGWVK